MSSDDVARRRPVVAFVIADAVALMVFVVAGIRSHHEVGAIDLFLRNAVPLEVAWFAVSARRGDLPPPGAPDAPVDVDRRGSDGSGGALDLGGIADAGPGCSCSWASGCCSPCCSCSPAVGSWR